MTFEEAKKRKEELEKTMIEIPGVHGIGIGLTPESTEREFSIYIDVDTKEAAEKVSTVVRKMNRSDDDIICKMEPAPTHHIGIVSEEEQETDHNGPDACLSDDELIPDRSRYRPVPGGVSISAKKGYYGTFCTFVISKDENDDRLYMLSNKHVFATIGNMVCQPVYDKGNRVGTVVRHADYTTQDAAIAEFTADRSNGSENTIQDYGKIGGYRALTQDDLGKYVIKRGARTRYTKGKIENILYTTYLVDGSVVYDCVKIAALDQTPTEKYVYSKSGDSGSPVIMEDEEKLVRLHFAGPASDSGEYGICCKITNVFDSLNIMLP